MRSYTPRQQAERLSDDLEVGSKLETEMTETLVEPAGPEAAAPEPQRGPSIGDVARMGSKFVFATADLFLGRWPGPRFLIYHQIGTYRRRQMEVGRTVFEAQLSWLQSHGRVVRLEEALQSRGTPRAASDFVLTFDDGYADLFEVAFPLLVRDNLPFVLYLATGHVESGEPMSPGATPLTWDEIGTMNESGLMSLGAHTHQHLDLRRASLHKVEEDLGLSDELISRRVGVNPRHFAYPWGYWSPIADTVVRSRYDSAALGGGPPITADTDPYLLHRLPVQRSDGMLFFKRKAKRGMRLEETTRRWLRGYHLP
ncbi:hypothetical protein BH18ACT6_BH18ACT6_05040 [soil metagenome]